MESEAFDLSRVTWEPGKFHPWHIASARKPLRSLSLDDSEELLQYFTRFVQDFAHRAAMPGRIDPRIEFIVGLQVRWPEWWRFRFAA